MWYAENCKDGDIIMMDLKWPFWPESTYAANWNVGISGESGGSFSFYGGYHCQIAESGPGNRAYTDREMQSKHRPGSIWSFWGANKVTGEPVRIHAVSRYNYPLQYGGESCSGAAGGIGWPLKADQWYTMLIRIWTPLEKEEAGYCYVGRWTKDVKDARWYLYGIAKVPTNATTFGGNCGFLEPTGGSAYAIRPIQRRLGYYRQKGEWKKSDTVTIDIPPRSGPFDMNVIGEVIEDGRVVHLEYGVSNKSNVPFHIKGVKMREPGKKYVLKVQQPDQPSLDKPLVENVEATSTGSQVVVSWGIPDNSSPQLYYKVEVFDNAKCDGVPVAVHESRMPITRNVLLDAAVKNPTVRLTVSDIFDQTATPVVVAATSREGPAARAASHDMDPGLQYRYYTKDDDRHVNVFFNASEKLAQSRQEKHFWISLDELDDGKLTQQGISNGFDTSLRGSRMHGYGFTFHGFLKVPKTGIYLFDMRGTDGYRLSIDDSVALEWDGLHGPEDRFFHLHLAEGFHPIRLDYFFDRQKPFLEINWQGPGMTRRGIPSTALYHQPDSSVPELELNIANATEDGKTLVLEHGTVNEQLPLSTDRPGIVTIAAKVNENGRKIEKVILYHDDMIITAMSGEELKAGGIFQDLLPKGKADLWARVFYDDNHTCDSTRVPIQVGSKPVEGWKVGVTGEKDSVFNLVQTAPNAFTFVGEGEFILNHKVKGDFTMTCKIDSYIGGKGEPVNNSAFAGLAVRENGNDHWFQRGQVFEFRRVAKQGLRTTQNNPDPAGGRMGRGIFQQDDAWIRITRQGHKWMAWSSPDGKKWNYCTTHHKRAKEEMDAGAIFSAFPQDAEMYFRASISNLQIDPGVSFDTSIDIEPAKGTANVTMAGIAAAPSDPKIAVLRTTDQGIFRTTDQGKTWTSANGNLTGPASAVRSLAIHPTNPDIMIRAAGYADENGTFAGGLYKTVDGGKSWKQLPFEGDFDGNGPMAVCGEVVVFMPHHPDIVLVGTETKGLFRSEDGGRTWENVIPAGPRFSAVKVQRFQKIASSYCQIAAVTCPDRFVPIIGRGKSRFTTSERNTLIYSSNNKGVSFGQTSSQDDLGYLNIGINYANEFVGLSTHGMVFGMGMGEVNFLYVNNHHVESLRPFIACGTSPKKDSLATRSIMMAVNPTASRPFSWFDGGGWLWTSKENPNPAFKGAIKIEPGDFNLEASADKWWVLGLDGLYYSDDFLETLKRVR